MKRKILVIYHWKKGYISGYGNVDCTVVGDGLSMENIREIERQICENNHLSVVIVLNIIELPGESEDTE